MKYLQIKTLLLFLLTCLAACTSDGSIDSSAVSSQLGGVTDVAVADVPESSVLYQYRETFDSWPEKGCREHSDLLRCNDSFIHTFDQPSKFMDVSSFSECRSGKCIKSVYHNNEDGRLFAPKNMRPPGTKEFYVRYYIKFANDFSKGFPQSFKQVRMKTVEGRHFDMILETIPAEKKQHFVFQNVFGGVKDKAECTLEIDLSKYLNRWIKVEASIKMNSIDGKNGFCEIRATPDNGKTYSIKEEGVMSTSTDRLKIFNHLQSNWSQGVGVSPSPTRTVFVDDVCVNGKVRERDTFCVE